MPSFGCIDDGYEMVYNFLRSRRWQQTIRRTPVQFPKILIFLATTALTSVWATPEGSIIEQVQAKYPITVMDANGLKVATPGAILVVQMDGVMVAQKGGGSGPYYNEFKSGII